MQELAQPFPSLQHDHDDCISTAMEAAEGLCRQRGLRFTALRRRVLTLVWQSHKPVGAYEILDKLGEEGRKAAPPTVYRALDFLIEAGLVHRLDSLNAFIGCPDPERSHSGQFLICRGCHTVAELDDRDIDLLVEQKARIAGFTAVHQMLEVQGLCSECRRSS
jgi:Fur family zinc uptake transcriptional regulator